MKRILYILILGFTLASCDDFLTEEPAHSQTLDNAVTNYDGAKNVINGMYATLTLGSGTSGSDFMCPVHASGSIPGRRYQLLFDVLQFDDQRTRNFLATMVCLREFG